VGNKPITNRLTPSKCSEGAQDAKPTVEAIAGTVGNKPIMIHLTPSQCSEGAKDAKPTVEAIAGTVGKKQKCG
jgi:hypothetical protein